MADEPKVPEAAQSPEKKARIHQEPLPPGRRFTPGPFVVEGARTSGAFASYDLLPGAGWPAPASGMCVSCGFLSRRAVGRSGIVERVSPEERQGMQLLQLASGAPAMPWCFVRAADLPREFDDWMEHPPYASQPSISEIAVTGGIIFKDRKCEEWWQLTDPLTPAEHRQEREVLKLEQTRAAREERMAAIELEVHKGSQEISKSLVEVTKQTSRFTTRWTRAAFVLGTAGITFAALAYFVPDGGRSGAGLGIGLVLLGLFGAAMLWALVAKVDQ